jgi:hypothetical protein
VSEKPAKDVDPKRSRRSGLKWLWRGLCDDERGFNRLSGRPVRLRVHYDLVGTPEHRYVWFLSDVWCGRKYGCEYHDWYNIARLHSDLDSIQVGEEHLLKERKKKCGG